MPTLATPILRRPPCYAHPATPTLRRQPCDSQLAFRSAQSLLALKKDHMRRILHLPPPPTPGQQPSPADHSDPSAAHELELHVSTYLRRTVDTFDLTKSIDVSLRSMYYRPLFK